MKKYLEDINFLINKLEEIHPNLYFNVSKLDIEKAILDFQKDNDIDDNKFIFFIKNLLKKINDPHTICLNHHQRNFPLKLKIIDNKVYIINASSEYKKYLYCEITKINDISISNIINELEQTISYQTKEWLLSCLEYEIIRPATLKSLPIFEKMQSDTIKYTLEKENNIETVEFDSKIIYGHDYLDNREYWYDYDSDNNILIINYKKCRENENYTMSSFAKDIDTIVKQNNINNIIVDIRGNPGGNSSVILPLIKYLENGFNIVTLTNGDIFSSGCWALNYLLNVGSKTVGTGIGTPFNHYGYADRFVLPNTNLRIECSTTYWNYDKGRIYGIKKDEFSINKPDLKEKIFEPDVYVENEINDYENNYDRQLETAKYYLNNKLKK